MSRTATYTALVLRCRQSGESNNEVTLLTSEEGILKATVFGGSKSKLRAHCAPYNSGQVWIYRDKIKDYAKLSDFDVHSWRAGLRELYERTMSASAIAETILSSHGGGGDWQAALKIAMETLDVLENANEELCGRLLVHFMWRWAHLLGIQPDINDNNINCEVQTEYGLVLSPGSRKWLSAVGNLEPAQLHRYSMDNKSFGEVKSLVATILTEALGKRLASWSW